MSAFRELLALPFLGALALWIIQEVVKARRAPELTLRFGQSAPWVALRLVEGADALFLRVRVENVGKSTARGCRVYLVGVRQGKQSRNLLDNPVEVQWAGGQDRERDLPPGVPLYVNVLMWKQVEPAPRGTPSDAPDNQFDLVLRRAVEVGETCLLFKFVATAHETRPYEDEVRCRFGKSWETLRWA